MKFTSRSLFILVVLLPMAALACARAELARAQQARADYQDCLAENPREPERCETLRDAMNREYENYEEVSGDRARSWRDDQKLPN